MAGDLFIDIKGLKEVINKFKNAPKTLVREMKKAMGLSMKILREKTPAYPPKRANQKTNYIRQGILAKSLGKTMGGGNAGKPTVYSIKASGGNLTGTYGTKLNYAKYVIDEQRQAHFHKGWWWTMQQVGRQAKDRIVNVWNDFISKALK